MRAPGEADPGRAGSDPRPARQMAASRTGDDEGRADANRPWPDLVLIDGGRASSTPRARRWPRLGVTDVPLVAHRQGAGPRRRPRDLLHARAASRSSCRRAIRCSISSSGCATRRIASPSARTGRAASATSAKPACRRSPASARPASARCCSISARSRRSSAPRVADLAQVPGISAETARKIYDFFHEGGELDEDRTAAPCGSSEGYASGANRAADCAGHARYRVVAAVMVLALKRAAMNSTTTARHGRRRPRLRAAEPADLCPHRRGAGGRRLHVLAEHPRRRAVAALGRAGDLHRRRHHRRSRRLFRPHLGPAIARSAACSIRSPTSSWWRPAC